MENNNGKIFTRTKQTANKTCNHLLKEEFL